MNDLPKLLGMIERRDHINNLFYDYSDPSKLMSNYQVLANLALIAERLDKLIREESARGRSEQELRDFKQQMAEMPVFGSKPNPKPVSLLNRILAWRAERFPRLAEHLQQQES